MRTSRHVEFDAAEPTGCVTAGSRSERRKNKPLTGHALGAAKKREQISKFLAGVRNGALNTAVSYNPIEVSFRLEDYSKVLNITAEHCLEAGYLKSPEKFIFLCKTAFTFVVLYDNIFEVQKTLKRLGGSVWHHIR